MNTIGLTYIFFRFLPKKFPKSTPLFSREYYHYMKVFLEKANYVISDNLHYFISGCCCSMEEKVFHDNDLSKPFHFSKNLLPTNNDCLRYVLSRTNMSVRAMSHTEAVSLMAKSLHDIWSAADCCPYTRRHITTLFEKRVWETYLHLLREKCLPGDKTSNKRSHKKDPSKAKELNEPVRKSQRKSTNLLTLPSTPSPVTKTPYAE